MLMKELSLLDKLLGNYAEQQFSNFVLSKSVAGQLKFWILFFPEPNLVLARRSAPH